MPLDTLLFVAAVVAVFGAFGLALFYVNLIAGARAVTAQEEFAARTK